MFSPFPPTIQSYRIHPVIQAYLNMLRGPLNVSWDETGRPGQPPAPMPPAPGGGKPPKTPKKYAV